MESIDAKPSVKACVVIRQSEVSCSFWADWSSTIWLNAGCFALNTCMLQGLFFFSFSHAGNTILIVMLSVGEIFLSALACVEVRLLRAVLGCFFFSSRPHKHIFNTPLPPTCSLPLVFSSRIVCFHAWAEKWEHPRGELALIHLRETGAKAEKQPKCCGVCPVLYFTCSVLIIVYSALNDGKLGLPPSSRREEAWLTKIGNSRLVAENKTSTGSCEITQSAMGRSLTARKSKRSPIIHQQTWLETCK